jgi:hypothetical protein
MASAGGNIKVVVRVRPFNNRGALLLQCVLGPADGFVRQNSTDRQNALSR